MSFFLSLRHHHHHHHLARRTAWNFFPRPWKSWSRTLGAKLKKSTASRVKRMMPTFIATIVEAKILSLMYLSILISLYWKPTEWNTLAIYYLSRYKWYFHAFCGQGGERQWWWWWRWWWWWHEKVWPRTLSFQVYPYSYVDSYDRLTEEHLPPFEAFYDKLRKEHISLEDYDNLHALWKRLKFHNLGCLATLYLTLDVLLLGINDKKNKSDTTVPLPPPPLPSSHPPVSFSLVSFFVIYSRRFPKLSSLVSQQLPARTIKFPDSSFALSVRGNEVHESEASTYIWRGHLSVLWALQERRLSVCGTSSVSTEYPWISQLWSQKANESFILSRR